jgi:hypothetical protein
VPIVSARLTSLLFLAAAGLTGAGGELRVRVSPAVGPCVEAVKPLYEVTFRGKLTLEVARLESAASGAGADAVVGAEGELTHLIEGGASHPDLDVDVATIPWVLVGPSMGATPDIRALDQPTVRVHVLGGTVGLEARRMLQHLPPENVRSLNTPSGPVQLVESELAVVPLSLAGKGRVSPLSLPPLLVRAVGMRTSANLVGARQFLAFLSRGPGNAAFRACGREPAR